MTTPSDPHRPIAPPGATITETVPYRRRDGRFRGEFEWHDEQGRRRRRSVTADTMKEADRRYAHIRNEILGRHAPTALEAARAESLRRPLYMLPAAMPALSMGAYGLSAAACVAAFVIGIVARWLAGFIVFMISMGFSPEDTGDVAFSDRRYSRVVLGDNADRSHPLDGPSTRCVAFRAVKPIVPPIAEFTATVAAGLLLWA